MVFYKKNESIEYYNNIYNNMIKNKKSQHHIFIMTMEYKDYLPDDYPFILNNKKCTKNTFHYSILSNINILNNAY